jgi:hypothetical protein
MKKKQYQQIDQFKCHHSIFILDFSGTAICKQCKKSEYEIYGHRIGVKVEQ